MERDDGGWPWTRTTVERSDEVAEDRLVGFTGRPAMRAVAVPNLALDRARARGAPNGIELHVRLAQPAERPGVADAREHRAPRIDETAGPQRMAPHRRDTAFEISLELCKIPPLDPSRHRRGVCPVVAV